MSQAELQQRLDKQFPQEHRLGDWGALSLASAELSLRGADQRVEVQVPVRLTSRLSGPVIEAQVSLSSGLRLEPSDNTVRLTDARVQRVKWSPSAALLGPFLESMAAPPLEKLMDDRVVYQLQPDQLTKLGQAGYKLGALSVKEQVLELRLEPAH